MSSLNLFSLGANKRLEINYYLSCMGEEANILDLQRSFDGSESATKEMFEILCARIRYYQIIKTKELVMKEVIDMIHWVSDFLPADKYPLRVNTIKNQLWESIGL